MELLDFMAILVILAAPLGFQYRDKGKEYGMKITR